MVVHISAKDAVKLFFLKTLFLSIFLISVVLPYITNSLRTTDDWEAIWLSWSDDPKTTITISWRWDSERRAYILYWNETFRGLVETDYPSEMFHITIQGLSPGCRYNYVIGYFAGDIMKNWSDIYRFRTAPEGSGSFKVLVHTDTHAPSFGYFQRFISNAVAEDFDFIIHLGDMVQDGRKEFWINFLETESEIASTHPLMAIPGNHEVMYGGMDNYQLFMALPGEEFWYYFVYGSAMFICLNVSSYDKFVFPEEEREMFISAIKYAEEHGLWKIVCLHIPPIEIFPHRVDEDERKILIPLLSKYQPDLVLMGHDHAYAREKVNNTTYIIVGPSGGFPHVYIGDTDSVDHYEFGYGYMILEISGDNITITYKNINGEILDRYVISR